MRSIKDLELVPPFTMKDDVNNVNKESTNYIPTENTIHVL
jgi:hypothetical protein